MLTLTSDQYLELVKDNQAQKLLDPGTTLEVTTDVLLPTQVEKLPDFPTVFLQDFNATHAKLKEFNHEVKGDADFTGVTSLVSFGPKAKFHARLMANGTALVEFNSEVTGACQIAYIATLISIGPNAKFHSTLYAEGTGITTFNSTVGGFAYLSFNKALKSFGPDAKFLSGMDASGTDIEEFNHEVNGIARFHNLIGGKLTVGLKAKFKSITGHNTKITYDKDSLTLKSLAEEQINIGVKIV